MTAPRTYDELARFMARALDARMNLVSEINERPVSDEEIEDMKAILDALAAHGIHPVADEETEEMVEAYHADHNRITGVPSAINAALKANPLRRKP